jgi:hypothetical protein
VQTGAYQAEVGASSGSRAKTFHKSEQELELKQLVSAEQHYLGDVEAHHDLGVDNHLESWRLILESSRST